MIETTQSLFPFRSLYVKFLDSVMHVFLLNEDSGSGDDEDYCPDGSYLCRRSEMCILESSLCDGVNNCGDWEDESVSVCGGK